MVSQSGSNSYVPQERKNRSPRLRGQHSIPKVSPSERDGECRQSICKRVRRVYLLARRVVKCSLSPSARYRRSEFKDGDKESVIRRFLFHSVVQCDEGIARFLR